MHSHSAGFCQSRSVFRGWLDRIASYISPRGSDKEAEDARTSIIPGPAEKILLKSDEALDAKHKAIEAERIARDQKTS